VGLVDSEHITAQHTPAQHSTAQHLLQELIDAAVLACTKTRRLCAMAIGVLQKLLLNKLLSGASRKRAIEALRHVSAAKGLDDEGIKLKVLQTCLTVLQLPDSVDDPDEARQVCTCRGEAGFGFCF
jgi:Dimerisation and cyclophilin-binding domain of Mon2